jgi:glycosyltransferase involved in cell wall biosynthesis
MMHEPVPTKDRDRLPLVSIVMNCYNGERYLREAIDSVYAQAYENWEIVFIDNASTDSTPAIVRQYDNRVKIVRNVTTVPLGESRNIALSHCSGELIAFLDCDDKWEPNKLLRQLMCFNNPQVGLVFSNCKLLRHGHVVGLRYSSNTDYAEGDCLGKLISDYFLVLSTVVIRRDVLMKLEEWFDPNLHVAEEADLFVRMALVTEFAVVDEPLASYRLHEQSETVQKGELYVPELERILDKLTHLVPQLRGQYAVDMERWLDKGHWAGAVSAWRKGSGKRARQALRASGRRTRKHYLLYAISVVPYRVCRGLFEVARRIIPLRFAA